MDTNIVSLNSNEKDKIQSKISRKIDKLMEQDCFIEMVLNLLEIFIYLNNMFIL